MTVDSEEVVFQGEKLRHLFLKPDGETRRALLLFHGQGDYAGRYEEVLAPLVEEGTLCFLTDFPGHGLSGGRRGHIPGYGFLDSLQEERLRRVRGMAPGLPLGVAGHSMGGHLVLREMLRRPGLYDFAWVSSPLLRFRTHPFLQIFLPLLAEFFPAITWTTGVTEADCRPEGKTGKPISLGKSHDKIALGWGTELKKGMEEAHAGLLVHEIETPLLITQGTADPVCPAEVLDDLVRRMPRAPTLRWAEGRLHEPFEGAEGAQLLQEVREWIGLVCPGGGR